MTKISTRIKLSAATAMMLTPLLALPASAHGIGLGAENGLRLGLGKWKRGLLSQDVQQKRHAVSGSVTAVSGTTLTLTVPSRNGDTKTFTIDANGATVLTKSGTGSLSDVSVGTRISVKGEVDGSNVDAETIHVMPAAPTKPAKPERPEAKPLPAAYEGDGSPIVIGKVTAVVGSTLTLDNKSSSNYTVNAAGADFAKGGKAQTLADIAVGDTVMVQGTVNGSNVTASSIIEQPGKGGHGFFGFLGLLFGKLFGA